MSNETSGHRKGKSKVLGTMGLGSVVVWCGGVVARGGVDM
jgi:hypothetical protein